MEAQKRSSMNLCGCLSIHMITSKLALAPSGRYARDALHSEHSAAMRTSYQSHVRHRYEPFHATQWSTSCRSHVTCLFIHFSFLIRNLLCQPSDAPRLFGILLHPVLRILLELCLVVLEFVRNACLHRVIRLRRLQHRNDQLKHICDLVRRLPLVCAEDTQAHGAAVIVGDVRMVDLGLEAESGWLERVLLRERDLDVEFAALCVC